MLAACGPGWEGYQDRYTTLDDVVESEPWTGDQVVTVTLDDQTVDVALAGLNTHDFSGVPAVALWELIEASALATSPADYRYDFTASDSYNLLTKREGDIDLLPSWTEMQHGFLYLDGRSGDLTSGWTEHPWGSALSAYQVKYMNGGRITLILYVE